MADNILDSYFIKVSALVDVASFVKLGSVLKNTEIGINNTTRAAVGSMIAFEAASISTFAAIGVGLINLADKTAMTDQSYRLMGLRMLMTKDSARALQTALHELGDVSIDEVAFDPELNKRFQYLYEQNVKLGKAMGEGFDKNMVSIRDLRMEYGRFGTELEFLGGAVISKLFEKLGLGSGDLQQQLSNLNDWFMENLPQIAEEISSDLIQPWNEAKIVLEDASDDVKLLGKEWQTMSGILLDDTSIQNQEVSIKSLIRTMGDWLDEVAKLSLAFSLLAKTGIHGAAAAFEGMASAIQGLRGNQPEANRLALMASAEKDLAMRDVTDIGRNVRSKMGGPDYQGWKDNPDFAGFKAYGEMKYGNKDDYDMSDFGPNFDKGRLPRNAKISGLSTDDKNRLGTRISGSELAMWVEQLSAQYGVDPERIAAMMLQESGGNPNVISKTGAMGLMQLEPQTAKQYGVKNPFDPRQNLEGGVHYFADLLKQYKGDVNLAEAAYNAGPGAVAKYGNKVPPYKETQDYVRRVNAKTESLNEDRTRGGGSVVIETININVHKDIPPEQWKGIVSGAIDDSINKRNRNTMAQTAGGGFY